MKITSEITLKGVDKKDSHEDLIDRVVEKCFEIENLDSDKVYVAITLTTPENIREINKEFRNIDKETDVLSFPIFEKKDIDMLRKNDEVVDKNMPQDVLGDIIISVNRNLWKKALSNIIGNAIRHSRGGAEVFISLQSSEQGKTLVFENTGAFISEADLPHMFTPFYRADKSRNKATGGSGLGLYIVKTILDLHGMEYKIANTENGVAFYLKLN